MKEEIIAWESNSNVKKIGKKSEERQPMYI